MMKVQLSETVTAYGPYTTRRLPPGEYEADVNRLGTVSVRAADDGELLWLHADTFEWATHADRLAYVKHVLNGPGEGPSVADRDAAFLLDQLEQAQNQIGRVQSWLADRDGYDPDKPFDEAVIALIANLTGLLTRAMTREG